MQPCSPGKASIIKCDYSVSQNPKKLTIKEDSMKDICTHK